MKLYHIAQWGNARDNNGNEPDTNVIVRANDLLSAVKLAEEAFKWYNEQYITKDTYTHYLFGKCDVAFLLGKDNKKDSKVIINPWIAHAFNHGGYEAWYRSYENETDDETWITQKEMYGE
jgi:hypothetical protein